MQLRIYFLPVIPAVEKMILAIGVGVTGERKKKNAKEVFDRSRRWKRGLCDEKPPNNKTAPGIGRRLFFGSVFGNGKALNARGTSESQELILSEKNRSFFPGNQGGFNLSNLCSEGFPSTV